MVALGELKLMTPRAAGVGITAPGVLRPGLMGMTQGQKALVIY